LPHSTQADVARQVAQARILDDEDLKFLMQVCNPQPALRAAPSAAMDEGPDRPLGQVDQRKRWRGIVDAVLELAA
jgi:hypothetical protein